MAHGVYCAQKATAEVGLYYDYCNSAPSERAGDEKFLNSICI